MAAIRPSSSPSIDELLTRSTRRPGATVAYFVLGGILFAALPTLQKEFMKYPAVFRTKDDMKRVMPMGMISIFVEILVVAVLYAMAYPSGGGAASGAQFGALIGVFAVCGFALHNHVNLNIGIKLTVGQAIAYFVQWLAVGIVISLIYAPASLFRFLASLRFN